MLPEYERLAPNVLTSAGNENWQRLSCPMKTSRGYRSSLSSFLSCCLFAQSSSSSSSSFPSYVRWSRLQRPVQLLDHGDIMRKKNYRRISTSYVNSYVCLIVAIIAIFGIRPIEALSCVQCCSCEGDSVACSIYGAPMFTYINTAGAVTCDVTTNVCGNVRLFDITNNQALTMKTCLSSSTCSALQKLTGNDLPFFLLGDIRARVLSTSCCTDSGCNAATPTTAVTIGGLILLLFATIATIFVSQ